MQRARDRLSLAAGTAFCATGSWFRDRDRRLRDRRDSGRARFNESASRTLTMTAKALPPGRFYLVRRCLAAIDGKLYFGEVFNGQQRIFVDPEHPSLRPPTQYAYGSAGAGPEPRTAAYNSFNFR